MTETQKLKAEVEALRREVAELRGIVAGLQSKVTQVYGPGYLPPPSVMAPKWVMPMPVMCKEAP